MDIFPHILVRIGGGSFNHLESISFTQLTEKSDLLYRLHEEKEQRKTDLSKLLFDYIKQLSDGRIQITLQNIRRDLYNERTIKQSALEEATQFLNEQLKDELNSYLAFRLHIHELEQDLKNTYDKEVRIARKHLQKLAGDENLQKGLILSSQILLDCVFEYQQKDPDSFKKKEYQTEYSLLKYLTRMYAKTSPFSTFNNLTLARLKENKEPYGIEDPKNGINSVISHIRLNNNLFKYLKDLFISSDDIYRQLLLRPNPTITDKGDHLLYLTNHNNVEAFQRIPPSKIVSIMLEIASKFQEGIPFYKMVNEMHEYIEAEREDLEKYVKKLVDFGFFEYDLGVSGTDPDWDLKLVKTLHPLALAKVPDIDELIIVLHRLRALATRYAPANVAERKALLNDAFSSFKTISMKLHENAGLPEIERKPFEELMAERRAHLKEQERNKKIENAAEVAVTEAVATEEKANTEEEGFTHRSSTYFSFQPEQIFYEDTVREVFPQFNHESARSWTEKLHMLLGEMRLFRGQSDEKDKMKHFFLQKFDKDTPADLLTFYEEYYREVKRPEVEQQSKMRRELDEQNNDTSHGNQPDLLGTTVIESDEDPRKVPAIEQRQKLKNEWDERCRDTLLPLFSEQCEVLPIKLKHLQAINLNHPKNVNKSPNSYGAFVQFYEEPDQHGKLQLKGVLNTSFSGYGKMMSRFMHIFPESFTKDLKEWNCKLMDEHSIFAEDCDASYFNANLHPPLMPFEIRMPGGHNNLDFSKQLLISDFDIRLNEVNQELMLMHKQTGKRTYVFDLGFQGSLGRSQLFQLLSKFTKAEYLFAEPLVDSIKKFACIKQSKKEGDDKCITIFPRIVYEEQIILQRKSWQIDKELIPSRKPHDSDSAYFMQINTWRKQLNIPDEVFVSITPNQGQRDRKFFKRLGRDDHKPQYINFNNPLLITVFEKVLAKIPAILKIEEMLPASGHLATVGKEKFVTECVLQWYTS